MIGWLFLLGGVLTMAIAAWWAQSNLIRPFRRLLVIAEQMKGGKRPANFLVGGAAPLARLGGYLEKFADDRESARSQHAEQDFNFRAILSSMLEGILVVDAEKTITLVNTACLDFFGLKNNPVGRSVLGAIREASVQELICATLESETVQSREISLPAIQGSARLCLMNAVPLKDADDRTSGVVAIFHDVSRLAELENVRRDFVANVSHELRTPLSIFHGYLENLIENPTVPRKELARVLLVMKKHSARLNALVEDLLSLARLEARDQQLERRPIDLAVFLKAVIDDWTRAAAQKNVALHLAVEADVPTLDGDDLRLEQVLNNVLDNALKHTPEGGEIGLSAAADTDHVILRVEDNGSGISPADLPHVFERFYRADKARTRELGGTGLGLSIVKHIMHLHGGRVEAQSTMGHGTTITLFLPRAGD